MTEMNIQIGPIAIALMLALIIVFALGQPIFYIHDGGIYLNSIIAGGFIIGVIASVIVLVLLMRAYYVY